MENQSNVQVIFDKICNKDSLSEKEVKYLIEGYYEHEGKCPFEIIDEKDGKRSRWYESKISILKLILPDGTEKLFEIKWKIGLTELQDNEYPEQTLKEVYVISKYTMYTDYKEVDKQDRFDKSNMYIQSPVSAFQLGIDPIPSWFDELIKDQSVELHDADQEPISCIIKLEDSNIMGKYSDYIIKNDCLSIMNQKDFEREYLCIIKED
jgi:hypothetical protein